MITSYEVGAVFKIINEASPTLLKILRQVRELNAAIDKTKANMAGLAKMPALASAIGETKALADAWRSVAQASATASRTIGRVTGRTNAIAGPGGAAAIAQTQQMANAYANLANQMAAVRAAGTGVRPRMPGGGTGGGSAGGGGAGGGRRGPPGFMNRGGGAHISGPSAPIPGGGHISFGGGAMAAAGLLGYGAYEAAQMEDAVWQLIYHSGMDQNDSNRSRFRKILQDSMAESGYSLHDVAESAKQEIRMFQGTPGGGIDVLPEMLRAATIESRLKGESPEESMRALIGLAHMTKQYDADAIKKLAPAFAFLSTANPSSLSSIEKSAGYAVPILQSSMGVDPLQALLMGTALTRAGATSTKSGTWLREMAIRAMPGTAIFESEKKAEHHDELLKRLGLLDDKEKPTWFTDDKPDLFKMLDLAGRNLDKIPMNERAGVERKLFGAQGSGGLALLTDPAVREQIAALSKEMNSSEFKNRYSGFVQAYQEGSTVQNARTGMATFNNLMADLGDKILPAVNREIADLKSVFDYIRGIIPHSPDPAKGDPGTPDLMGKAVTGMLNAGKAVTGGVVEAGKTGAMGAAEAFMQMNGGGKNTLGFDRAGTYTSPGKTGHPAQKIEIQTKPVTLNLNIDGRALAQAVSEQQAAAGTYQTDSSAPNGVELFGP